MNDMSAVIVAKSDQWNADDFTAGPRTFTVEDVQIKPGTEQPVQIRLAGSPKVFRPCKTVSRVLVAGWGADATAYRGRSLTLYTDPDVTWAGMKVGGIRISHMSDLDKALVIALQEKKGSRKMTTVQPLKVDAPAGQNDDPAARWAQQFIDKLPTLQSIDDVAAFEASKAGKLDEMSGKRPELHQRVSQALKARYDALSPAKEGRLDEDHGDQHDDMEASRD